MSYSYNPTPAESSLLAQIAQRESSGNYSAINPASGTAGAYQFANSTWAMAAANTGVGTQYASAADAPAWMQDTNALWLLRYVGPNSTESWYASGVAKGQPYSYPSNGGPIIDLSGDAATAPTSNILDQLQTAGFPNIDLTTPSGLAVAAGIVGLVILVMYR